MNNTETEIMSFPSDILSPEDQAAIFEDIDIAHVNEILNGNSNRQKKSVKPEGITLLPSSPAPGPPRQVADVKLVTSDPENPRTKNFERFGAVIAKAFIKPVICLPEPEENDDTERSENNYIDEKDYKDENLFMVLPPSEQLIPPVISNILSNEEYLGPFEFEVDICPNGSKNPWVYSPSLNKIFMDMNSPFPVDFKIKRRPGNPLYIRVTPVYSLPQHSQEPVYRCINHEHQIEKGNPDVRDNVRQHIIRCSNPSAIYLGDRQKGERLSVVMRLAQPQTGAESVREIFQFVCKNSCPMPGMNRRPIEVIFTLEDHSGHILGRQTLRVRICSCPKRDKEKEEKENNTSMPPKGKKRKVEKPEKKAMPSTETDNKEYEVKLNLVGKHNVQQVLKYCHDLMAGEILRHGHNGVEPYKNCLNGINNLMNKPLD